MTQTSLRGWKEIAGFFNTSERTAHRWERAFGMPVHRVPGTRGVLVFAEIAELEEWRRGRDLNAIDSGDQSGLCSTAPERFRSVPIALVVATLTVVIGVAAGWAWLRPASSLGSRSTSNRNTHGNSPEVSAAGSSAGLIAFEVQLPGTSSPIHLTGVNGGLVTIAAEGAEAFGLVPRVRGDAVDALVLLLPGEKGEARQVGTLHLLRAKPVSFSSRGVSFDLTWTGLRARSNGRTTAPPTGEGCRVTCDRVSITAAAVDTVCGRCCDPTECAATNWIFPPAATGPTGSSAPPPGGSHPSR